MLMKIGFALWPSSILLSRWMLDLAPILDGKIVVELGCGCGMPGITAGSTSTSILINYNLNLVSERIIM